LNRDILAETGSLALGKLFLLVGFRPAVWRSFTKGASRPAQFSASRKPSLARSTRLCDAGMNGIIFYFVYKSLGKIILDIVYSGDQRTLLGQVALKGIYSHLNIKENPRSFLDSTDF